MRLYKQDGGPNQSGVSMQFETKDSGKREEYASGMVRDSADKDNYSRCADGPLLRSWADIVYTYPNNPIPDPTSCFLDWWDDTCLTNAVWVILSLEERENTGESTRGSHPFCTIMFQRWSDLLKRGAEKYPDVKPGVPNWTLAIGNEEKNRFRESAFRHFVQWVRGDKDEDHAAAVIFNMNGYHYVEQRQEWE